MVRNSKGKSASGAATDLPADPNADPYQVGPGRPPKEHQFRPGQSGNPSGARRKKSPTSSLLPDVKAILEAALRTKVALQQGEKARVLTKLDAGIEQLVHQFASGDRYARRDLIVLAKQLGIDLVSGQTQSIKNAVAAQISQDDEALLKDFLRRHRDDPPDNLPEEPNNSESADAGEGEQT
jgi:hypothetical protein